MTIWGERCLIDNVVVAHLWPTRRSSLVLLFHIIFNAPLEHFRMYISCKLYQTMMQNIWSYAYKVLLLGLRARILELYFTIRWIFL